MRHVANELVPAPSESGATATEYLFLLVLIALVLAAGVQTYGSALGAKFSDGVAHVTNAN